MFGAMSKINGMTHLSQQSLVTKDGEHKSQTNPRKRKPQAELCSPFSTLAIETPLTRTAPSYSPASGSQIVPSQTVEQDDLKQPPHRKHQTEKQGIYKDIRKDIKRTTRRVNILRKTDQDQDREPKRIDPFNALPQFEYLEIAEQLTTDMASGLDGFRQMDLSERKTCDDGSPENPLAPFLSVNASSDEHNEIGWESELNEFRHMDSPSASAPDTMLELPMSSLIESDEGDAFWLEDLRVIAADLLARIRETGFDDVEPTEDEATTTDQPLSNFSSQAASSRQPVNEGQLSANGQQFPLDNSPCTSFSCPIEEPHNEGPYYHNGVLGDQNHVQ